MALRKVWKQVKDFVGQPIGLCGTSPDLLPLVNEACEILWDAGDWIHKFARYKMRVTSDCNNNRVITWPTQIETIEAIQSCNSPIGVRNVYFEFIENAPGSLDSSNAISGLTPLGINGWWGGGRLMGDRDEVCTFEDIRPGYKKVKAYNFLLQDDGFQIIIMGYDDNNNWIRTLQGGVYVDGEYLTLNAGAPPTTVNFFSSIVGIQFSATPRSGDITITEVNTQDGNSERFLATYGYNQDIPIYRRSVLTGFGDNNCQAVTALCRLRYMPIATDTDYLQIGKISALKNMLISLQKRDNGLVKESEAFQQKAINILDNELRQYQGIAPKKVVSFQTRGLWGASYNMQ